MLGPGIQPLSVGPQHINAEPVEPLPLDFECGQLDGETQLRPRAPVARVAYQPVQHSGYEGVPCSYGTISRTVVSSCSSTRLVLCVVLSCDVWDMEIRWTYSTTEMSPPDLLWTGQRQRRVSPVDRGNPAAPSSPHVQTASDLCIHRLISQQTQAVTSAGKHVFLFIIRTPYDALRLSGILPGCCAHDSMPLLDHINHDSPTSFLSPLSPQPNFANRRQRLPLPPILIGLPYQASRLRR